MKISYIYYTIIGLVFIISACSTPQNQMIREVRTDSGVITEIDLTILPGDTLFLNLSDIVSEVEMIPLETSEKCLISNTWERFTDDYIFIGTQNFPGPARLYRFDKNGKFINEIGRGGGGPGEHKGYTLNILKILQEGNVLVHWGDRGKVAQLFNVNGDYMGNVNIPFEFAQNCNRWSDSIWFTVGKFWGHTLRRSDSIAVIFYSSDGEIMSSIPRQQYPRESDEGYIPPGSTSIYHFNGAWKLFMSGSDTVYKIIDKNLLPETIILPGIDAMSFNTGSSPDQNIGKYRIDIIAETDNYWILDQQVLTEVDAHEIYPGTWGGMHSFSSNLILIDKLTKEGRYIRIQDDLYSLLPDGFFFEGMFWQGEGFFSRALPVVILLDQIEQHEEAVSGSPQGPELMELVRSLDMESNPIVFKFWLKDRIKMI